MKFSVLMSVYAGDIKEHFEKALESVIHQTLKPNEIIIIVDGIIEHRIQNMLNEYKKKYPQLIKIFHFKVNVGLGEAMNRGIKYCKHNVIARMDSDDIAREKRFEKQINYLRENPEVDIVGSYISEFIDDPSYIVSIRKVPVNDRDIKRYAKRRSPFNHMTVMFKKEAILRAGNYQKFPLLEDYFLWVRLLSNKVIAHNIPECLVYARIGNGMFNRRGGKKYFLSELKLQLVMYKMSFINLFELSTNILIRLIFRMVPTVFRARLYNWFLREHV
ncbi:glycosyltransferase [Niallia sp. Krafla_26]|uniref:glycosyltransferase n=1 Tax=Niallia sp. Krafla_26 TaxID=3064703 RepID=UPI003D17F2A0